jgi:SseB protein N-terminal domain
MIDDDLTPLDRAHLATEAVPDDDAARLRFYAALADTELFLLIEAEAAGDIVSPQVFDLADGRFVMGFDSEDRLAAFSDAPAAYAALPGRVVVRHLAGQGVGIGLNLGVAPSSVLLPAVAIDWFAATLTHAPDAATGQARRIDAPRDVPDALVASLARAGSAFADLAARALLADVTDAQGRRSLTLALIGVPHDAEAALAQALSEAVVFSGISDSALDLAFLAPQDTRAARFLQVGQALDIPRVKPQPRQLAQPDAPGMDPARPPQLK